MMQNWLKALIAAACVTIVVAGSYFIWRDHQDKVERNRLTEIRTQQAVCDLMMSEFKSGKIVQDWRVLHVTNCIVGGYLSEADFSTPELQAFLAQAKDSIAYERGQKQKP